MRRLFSRFFRSRVPAEILQVRVYTREHCGCCHKALDLLQERQARFGLSIETIDIESDPALEAEHGLSVPVVELGGKVRFRGVVNPTLLDRLLKAEIRGR
ncbi:hypothetical protein BH23PLA1_BH23PLA1_44840 [soil metagenome]